jgi:hypothetical protein
VFCNIGDDFLIIPCHMRAERDDPAALDNRIAPMYNGEMTAGVQSVEKSRPGPRGIGFLIDAGIVILLGLSQVFLGVFIIPRFSAIFREMHGNYPLPAWTVVVLHYRWALVVMGCVCSLAAVFVVQRRAPTLYLIAILVLQLVQIAFITIALFQPLIVDIKAQ